MPRLTAAKVEERLVKEFVRSRLPNVNYLQQVADDIGEPLVFVQDWFKQKRRDTPKTRQPVAPAPVRPAVSRPRTRSRRQASPPQSANPARVRTPSHSPAGRSRTPSVPPQPSNSARVTTPTRRSRTRSPRQASPAPTVATVTSQIFPARSYDRLVKPLVDARQLPPMPRNLRFEIDWDFLYEKEDYSVVAGKTFSVKETIGGFQVVDGRWREIRNKVEYTLPQYRFCYPPEIANAIINLPGDEEYDDDDDEDFYRKLLIQKLICSRCSDGIMTLRCNKCFAGFCCVCVTMRAIRKRLGARLNCPKCDDTGPNVFAPISFPLM